LQSAFFDIYWWEGIAPSNYTCRWTITYWGGSWIIYCWHSKIPLKPLLFIFSFRSFSIIILGFPSVSNGVPLSSSNFQ
jgi:hypothetical protein